MADPSANVFNGRFYIYPSHASIPLMTGMPESVSTMTAVISR